MISILFGFGGTHNAKSYNLGTLCVLELLAIIMMYDIREVITKN
jgi:hypothetical protein